jgi:hypothetical protein
MHACNACGYFELFTGNLEDLGAIRGWKRAFNFSKYFKTNPTYKNVYDSHCFVALLPHSALS